MSRTRVGPFLGRFGLLLVTVFILLLTQQGHATTTNNLNVLLTDVQNASYWAAMDGGSTWRWTQRTDAGAWTPTTTRRPCMGLRFVSFNPTGGGLLVHPGLGGGMRG